MQVVLHKILKTSLVNGPGKRYVIFFQGCNFNCPHCINPETHDISKGFKREISDIIREIKEVAQSENIEGVTFTGGEPLLQFKELKILSEKIHALNLSIVLSTGHEVEEILKIPNFNSILANLDVILAGRYHHELRIAHGFIGSSNKRIIFLSDRYSISDFSLEQKIEINFNGNEVIGTGTALNDIIDLKQFFYTPSNYMERKEES